MTCRIPGHKHCTKEMAGTVAGGLMQASQALKAWVVLGNQWGCLCLTGRDTFATVAPSQAANVSLWKRGANVPLTLHERMSEMASQGLLPTTSLHQRERNRRTGSDYRVPTQLQEALEHGYISPNLPPPAGLKWVHKAGEWTLVPRGG